MKIRITEKEIAQILLAAVTANIAFKTGSEPDIKFTATRGEEGIVAEIDVPYVGVSQLDLSSPTKGEDSGVDTTSTVSAASAPTEPAKATRAPRGSKAAGKTLFGSLTSPAQPSEDAAAEQSNDSPAAADGEDDPPFPTTETSTETSEAAAEAGTEGDAEQAETPPPQKGRSLFDK